MTLAITTHEKWFQVSDERLLQIQCEIELRFAELPHLFIISTARAEHTRPSVVPTSAILFLYQLDAYSSVSTFSTTQTLLTTTLAITIHEKWMLYFWNHLKILFTAIYFVVTLGIPLLYSISFTPPPASSQWTGQREQSSAVDHDIELAPVRSNPDNIINVDIVIIEAFKAQIEIIIGHWQMIQYGSGVLIAAALTLPQLQTSRPDNQSSGLPSFFSALCGLAALLFTFIFLSHKKLLANPTTIIQWSEASELPCIKYSSLWDMLSIPAIWFSW
ncbi:hypothetical protein BDQ12DRAFT_727014 [Crucibulum laeve]|uniref:Uncharacterized protein n=1 Tax=Crucibulum laeve TaxID=68775 RepID=A0A5C3LNJ7_9AGAR|nr:hypothetical protein BDQ12DRAFT_727014 [Crucibulum laeve]